MRKGSKPVKVFKAFQPDDTIDSKSGSEKGAYRPSESEKTEREEGMLVEELAAQGLGHFNPDLFFENLASDFRSAKEIYGERLISLATGESAEYVERNIRIPEFEKELREKLKKHKRALEKRGLVKADSLTQAAYTMAAQNFLSDALEQLYRSSFNESHGSARSTLGTRSNTKPYRDEPYRDIDVRKTLRTAARRGHERIAWGDLRASERVSRPKREIVFCVDASGSMKGEKIAQARRAFFSLAARAQRDRDRVGLLTFSSEGEAAHHTSTPLPSMLISMVEAVPRGKTSLARAIGDAQGLFTERDADRHIILITDMNPTEGYAPEEEALDAAGQARERSITISVVAVRAEERALELGQRIAALAQGRFYEADASSLGAIVLHDYELARKG